MIEISRKLYLLHFRPVTVSAAAMRYTYSWGLGGMAAGLICLLMVTGVLLKFVYIPTPDKAYDSIVTLQQTVIFGGFIRNIHHWSANILVIVAFLHMLRVFFTGAFKEKRKLNWIIGFCLLGTVLMANFTGYLLPWDQLAYWAVTICTAMLAYIPGIGGWLQEMLIGGAVPGPETLSNFFALHTAIVPLIFISLTPFHFWRIRKSGGLAATGKTKARVVPHLIVREMVVLLSVLAVVLTMSALWDAPLGDKANPGLSPNPTKAPWYFAGLQELLLHLHPMVAVAVIPLLVTIVSFLLPFLPYGIETPGVWFCTDRGRRLAIGTALAAATLVPLWVIGNANGFQFLTWLAPVFCLAASGGIYGFSRYRMRTPIHEAVQACGAFLVTGFIVLTIIGIWFRGPSMALVWPWK